MFIKKISVYFIFIFLVSLNNLLSMDKIDNKENRKSKTESGLIEDIALLPPVLKNIIKEYANEWVLYKTIIGPKRPPVSARFLQSDENEDNINAMMSVVGSVAYSFDNKYLASTSWDKTIKIWDVIDNYKLLHTLEGHKNLIYSLVFSADNKFLASGDDKTINIWDADTYKLLRTIAFPKSALSLAYSSKDNKYLAAGSASLGDVIQIFDVNDNYKLSNTITGYRLPISSLAYSIDNKNLASGSMNRSLKIMDVNDNYKILKELTTLTISVKLKYSNNGKYLACGSGVEIIIMDVNDNYKILHTLTHKGDVTSLAYSPDNRFLASGDSDNTIKIWDANTYRLLQTLTGNKIHVSSVAFSQDSKYLAAGLDSNTIKIWHYEGIE